MPTTETPIQPFTACAEAPFIFVSYAHADAALVYPVLKELYETGWNLWYDEGIQANDPYLQSIAEHIGKCDLFLVFWSSKSLKSEFVVNREFVYASQTLRKEVVSVVLEDTVDFSCAPAVAMSVSAKGAVRVSEIDAALRRYFFRPQQGKRLAIPPAARQGATYDIPAPTGLSDFEYVISGNGIKLTRYRGDRKKVVIPASHGGLPVISWKQALEPVTTEHTDYFSGGVEQHSVHVERLMDEDAVVVAPEPSSLLENRLPYALWCSCGDDAVRLAGLLSNLQQRGCRCKTMPEQDFDPDLVFDCAMLVIFFSESALGSSAVLSALKIAARIDKPILHLFLDGCTLPDEWNMMLQGRQALYLTNASLPQVEEKMTASLRAHGCKAFAYDPALDDWELRLVNADSEVEVIRYLGDSLNVTIPEAFFSPPRRVTSVASYAFPHEKRGEVTLPPGIRRIEGNAFAGWKMHMGEIKLPLLARSRDGCDEILSDRDQIRRLASGADRTDAVCPLCGQKSVVFKTYGNCATMIYDPYNLSTDEWFWHCVCAACGWYAHDQDIFYDTFGDPPVVFDARLCRFVPAPRS